MQRLSRDSLTYDEVMRKLSCGKTLTHKSHQLSRLLLLQVFLCPFNRHGVYTPKKGGASVSRHEFVMHRLAFGWSNPKTGRDFGRRPRQPAGNVLATRASVPAPKTSADARRPRRESRTQFGNPRNPDRESGPIPGGWAGPTNPLGDRLPAGRV